MTIVNKVELSSDFATIRKDLKQFDILSGTDPFIDQMKAFQKEAQDKFDSVEKSLKETESTYEHVVALYGENSKTVQPNEFFSTFSTFTTSWQVKQHCSSIDIFPVRADFDLFIEMLG